MSAQSSGEIARVGSVEAALIRTILKPDESPKLCIKHASPVREQKHGNGRSLLNIRGPASRHGNGNRL